MQKLTMLNHKVMFTLVNTFHVYLQLATDRKHWHTTFLYIKMSILMQFSVHVTRTHTYM